MSNQNSYTLIDQQNGNLAFKILPFENNVFFDHLQRLNYFSLILVLEGKGFIRSDVNEFELKKKLVKICEISGKFFNAFLSL